MPSSTLRKTIFSLCFLAILILSTGCGGGFSTVKVNQTPQTCGQCQFVYSTTNSGEILTFPVSSTGALGTPTSVAGPANSAGIITLVPGGTQQVYLYVSDPGDNTIRVYNIARNGSIAPASVGPYPLGNANGTAGELALFGTTLYVASSGGGISAFSVNSDGSLATVAGSPFAAGVGLSHLAVIPSETVANTTFLYAANTDDANGSISAFNIRPNGALAPVAGSPFATVPGGGPAGFYDGGKILYVALQNANGVAALNIADDGSLTPVAGSPFSAGHGTSSLTGADGFLFATNNSDGTISSYSIDPFSGVLAEVSGSPFSAAVSSGDTLYVNGKLFVPDASANSITGFEPDLTTGAVASLTGSPYQAGAGPLSLTIMQFPAFDPP